LPDGEERLRPVAATCRRLAPSGVAITGVFDINGPIDEAPASVPLAHEQVVFCGERFSEFVAAVLQSARLRRRTSNDLEADSPAE
jgi:hypothetical protein